MSKRDEFDTVAAWTVEAIRAYRPGDAVPAACNGSGNPAWLRWLAEQTGIRAGMVVVDTGGGLGGPAAWLADDTGADVIVSEPMPAAAAGSHELFGRPAVVAWSHQLPLAGRSVDVALALAVLSTVEDKSVYLRELRRVLRLGGHLGLIEYVSTTDRLPGEPANNEFLGRDELIELLTDEGFRVEDWTRASRLPDPPAAWAATDEQVTEEIERRHGDQPAWRETAEQRRRFGQLLGEDKLEVVLVSAESVSTELVSAGPP